jgi:hypothetical protein
MKIKTILKLLGEFSIKNNVRCYLEIFPDGHGWIVNVDRSFFEFKDLKQLKYKLKTYKINQ